MFTMLVVFPNVIFWPSSRNTNLVFCNQLFENASTYDLKIAPMK